MTSIDESSNGYPLGIHLIPRFYSRRALTRRISDIIGGAGTHRDSAKKENWN